jgi:hypothetical protein
MKRCLIMIGCAVLAASVALAQEKKDLPPPPADNGPSLEITMKFIQEKFMAKAINPTSHRYTIDVSADPASCQLKIVSHDFPPDFDWMTAYSFSLRDVEKIEVMSLREYFRLQKWEGEPSHPDAFSLRILTTTERSVHYQRTITPKKGKPDIKPDRYFGEYASSLY